MHVALLCVVPDGTSPTDGTLPRVAMPTAIQWPVGDGGTIAISVESESGGIYDLDGCAMTLVCREKVVDLEPAFAYDAAIDATPQNGTAPGTATVTVSGSDTEAMIAGQVYWYDVRLVDSDDAVFHILPPSKWIPTMTIARADEPAPPVTPPETP